MDEQLLLAFHPPGVSPACRRPSRSPGGTGGDDRQRVWRRWRRGRKLAGFGHRDGRLPGRGGAVTRTVRAYELAARVSLAGASPGAGPGRAAPCPAGPRPGSPAPAAPRAARPAGRRAGPIPIRRSPRCAAPDPLVETAALGVTSTRAARKSSGSRSRLSRPYSSNLPMTRDSMVGLMPSSSVSSARLSGPRMVVIPSTEGWVGVSPSSRDAALSCRASFSTTRLRRMTVLLSMSVAPWS